jgi:hypothetical protein
VLLSKDTKLVCNDVRWVSFLSLSSKFIGSVVCVLLLPFDCFTKFGFSYLGEIWYFGQWYDGNTIPSTLQTGRNRTTPIFLLVFFLCVPFFRLFLLRLVRPCWTFVSDKGESFDRSCGIEPHQAATKVVFDDSVDDTVFPRTE